jgi:hypothetical protein
MTQLDAILDDTRARSREAHAAVDAALKQIKAHHKDRVREMLTPEQRPQYEKLLVERDQRAKAAGKN